VVVQLSAVKIYVAAVVVQVSAVKIYVAAVVVQVSAVKIYVAAVDETQFTTKIGGKTNYFVL